MGCSSCANFVCNFWTDCGVPNVFDMFGICVYPEKSGQCENNYSVSEILKNQKFLRKECLETILDRYWGGHIPYDVYVKDTCICNGCKQYYLCKIEELSILKQKRRYLMGGQGTGRILLCNRPT